MSETLAYLCVLFTIALTAYGQLVLKWQVLRAGPMPAGFYERLLHLGLLLLNPWVLSAFLAAFLASLSWMAAMSRLPISRAYPLNAMTFVIVVVGGAALFSEPLGAVRLVGLALVVSGIVIGAMG